MTAESLRHQDFDWLAENFFALVAEKPFCLRIHHVDAPGGVDHDHRVRRGLNDPSKPLLAPAKGAFDLSRVGRLRSS
jgi:hypothetical protein